MAARTTTSEMVDAHATPPMVSVCVPDPDAVIATERFAPSDVPCVMPPSVTASGRWLIDGCIRSI